MGTCRASCGLLPCPRLPQPSPTTHTGPKGQEAHTWPLSERCHLTAPLTHGVTSIRSILCDECLSTPRCWAWAGPQPFWTSVQWEHPREAVGTLGPGASGARGPPRVRTPGVRVLPAGRREALQLGLEDGAALMHFPECAHTTCACTDTYVTPTLKHTCAHTGHTHTHPRLPPGHGLAPASWTVDHSGSSRCGVRREGALGPQEVKAGTSRPPMGESGPHPHVLPLPELCQGGGCTLNL